MLNKQAIFLITTTLLGSALNCYADQRENPELTALLEILEQQTEIATKTGLNRDYVPGQVNILHGNDLEKRGIHRLGEALRLVPGLDVQQDETGTTQVLVRGLAKTYASSNLKLMLNGVPLNAASTSSAASLYQMPISQIRRIEVIRGPGSAVHGEFALMGVVNVLTRTDDSRVSVELDNDQRTTIGGNHHWQSDDKVWSFAMNAALWDAPGGEIDAGPDGLFFDGFPEFSNAPGEANSKRRYGALLFSADNEDYRVSLQILRNASGDYFGINTYLPPDQRLVSTTSWYNIEGERRFRLDDGHRAEVRAGWLRTDLDTDERYVGPPEIFGGPPGPDIVADVELTEDRGWVDIDYLRDGESHDLLLGAGISYAKVGESRQALNLSPSTFLPTADKNEFPTVIEDGGDRWNYFLTLQDEWRVNEKLSLTAGVRYDYYDDAGDALSPRLAAVYRLNRDTTLKAQYARAFRPPTLLETGGQIDDIQPVYSDSIEAAAIFGRTGARAALTLFHHDVNDLIVFTSVDGEFGFDNVAEARTTGAELEWEKRLSRFWSVDGNLSYSRSSDRSTGNDIVDSARWLGNLGIRVTPVHDLDFHLQINGHGDRDRAADDPRPHMPSATTTDITVSWQTDRELLVRAGIRNLADKTVRDPSPFDGYQHDFPRGGRTLWLGLIFQPKS